MTANAEKIYNVVSLSTEHLNAEELHRKLGECGEKMSLATVYNSLARLHAEGLVRKIPMDGQPDRYDKTIRHDHLVCKNCGGIKDAMLKDYREIFSESLGERVESYDLQLFYLCDKCRKRGE